MTAYYEVVVGISKLAAAFSSSFFFSLFFPLFFFPDKFFCGMMEDVFLMTKEDMEL